METWGNYVAFPPVVKKASAGREYKTEHVGNDYTDVFNSRWESGRWRFSLSGASISGQDIELWDAFVDAIEGQARPFLFWLKSRRFELRDERIATGDGTRKRFQLQKSRAYAYGPTAAPKVETVRFPVHLYPPILFPSGVPALGREEVKVWVNGVPQRLEVDFYVIREGGHVCFYQAPPPGAAITASCRFMILVHGQDWMPAEASGSAGVYEFGGNSELFQAKGEEDALFAALDALL